MQRTPLLPPLHLVSGGLINSFEHLDAASLHRLVAVLQKYLHVQLCIRLAKTVSTEYWLVDSQEGCHMVSLQAKVIFGLYTIAILSLRNMAGAKCSQTWEKPIQTSLNDKLLQAKGCRQHKVPENASL